MSSPTKAGWKKVAGCPSASLIALGLIVGMATTGARGQQTATPPQNSSNAGSDGSGQPMGGWRPPMERAFHMGPHGRWWNNPDLVKKLNLSADQQKKMDAILEQNRPALFDLSGSLRKQEMGMGPLLSADAPDEGKIVAQIDHIAQARAELEKANARMLLGLRRVLTPDQWKTLQADEAKGDFGPHHPHFGPMGPPPPDDGQTH